MLVLGLLSAPRRIDRLAAAFLLVLLAVGSLTLWIGVPAGWLWVASKITNSQPSHFLAAIVGTPLAIALFAWVLVWINRLYMRVRWAPFPPEQELDEDEEPRPLRGPLEPLLVGSLAIAIVVLTVWFFVFAENPPRHFI